MSLTLLALFFLYSLAVRIACGACCSISLSRILFFAGRIAWVPSIAVPFRGCSLVRWRASNDELRSLPTQRSGSLAPSPSCLARSLPRSRLLTRSPSRPSSPLARIYAGFARRRVRAVSFYTGWHARGRRNRRAIAGSPWRRIEREREREIGRYTTCASAKNVYTYGCYLRGGKSTPCERRLPRREGRSEPSVPLLSTSAGSPLSLPLLHPHRIGGARLPNVKHVCTRKALCLVRAISSTDECGRNIF